MKKLYIYLTFLILICSTSSFAQYVKYEVKVVLDSVANIKGTLQKVSPEGIAIEDFKGNYFIFKAKNIVKIKVRRKGLTVIEGLGAGAGIGLGLGAAIFFSNDTFDQLGEKLVGTAFFTGLGALGGTLGGLLGEALNTQLIMNVNGDTQKFKKNYLKLEKFTKSYYLDQPVSVQ